MLSPTLRRSTAPARPGPGRIRVTEALSYVGHSTLLLEAGGARFLTDPVLGRGVGHIRRRVPVPRIESLLPLDAVLLSHPHHDHLHPRSLKRVAHDCPVVAPAGCGRMLRRGGIREVIEVEAGDRVAIGGVAIEAVPAVHDGRRYPIGPPRAALGFLIDGPVRTYFAGDTDLSPAMEALAGRVDVAALPVWGWGRARSARSPQPGASRAGRGTHPPAFGHPDPLGDARRDRLSARHGSARAAPRLCRRGCQDRPGGRGADPDGGRAERTATGVTWRRPGHALDPPGDRGCRSPGRA